MKKIRFLFIMALLIVIVSCEESEKENKKHFTNGVFISNEGNFSSNNGSVSFFDPDSNKITNEIFNKINGTYPGDVVQSVGIGDGKLFIVANNSEAVQVAKLGTMDFLGEIRASYPRYFLYGGNSKGYLTNGQFPGEVLVINTSTYTVEKSIPAGTSPENLVINGNRLIVANGKWGMDTTITVIDMNNEEVIQTVPVGDGPTDLAVDKNGDIWVLCQGIVTYNDDFSAIIYESDSRLIKLDGLNYTKKWTAVVGQKGDYYNPWLLASDKEAGIVYFSEIDGVYSVDVSQPAIADQPFISDLNLYGLEVDPATGNVFCFESTGFTTAGKVLVYSSKGEKLFEGETGIAPNGAAFN